jgi:hypothetical protein
MHASKPTRRNLLLGSLSLLVFTKLPALAETTPMNNSAPDSVPDSPRDFGALNPHAPPALSHFAFLIGKFRCEAKIKSADGTWQPYIATWTGRYILDGYAIADQYRMTAPSGDLIVLGMNFRSYDPAQHAWNIKWLNALTGDWMDLVSPSSTPIAFNGESLSYIFKEPTGGAAYTRATYTRHSPNHFTWSGDKSDDLKSWSEFMIVECFRTE